MKLYRRILVPDGIIHLKTDSRFMFTYTVEMLKVNRLPVLMETADLHRSGQTDEIFSIRTFYEQQWLARGLNIHYLKFVCEEKSEWIEPAVEIEHDSYRSFHRGALHPPILNS
jgi:tRNA (guanine-N7-)-methyltransferase